MQPRCTTISLLRGGLVRRWCAANSCRDQGILEEEPVIATGRFRLVREACPVQRSEEPVSRAITGKHSSGPVRPVRSGSEADDQDARVRVSEGWNGSSPVRLFAEGRPLLDGDLLAPCDEAGAVSALRNPGLQFVETQWETLQGLREIGRVQQDDGDLRASESRARPSAPP